MDRPTNDKAAQLVKLINSQLMLIAECGITYDDIELILDYCQSLNKYLKNKGLEMLCSDLLYQLSYHTEPDVILFVENNDVIRRIVYFCSLV